MSLKVFQASDARQHLPAILNDVVRKGVPVEVSRRGGERAVIIARDQLAGVLLAFRFHPERLDAKPGSFSYWLPELAVYSFADDDGAARRELAAEVLDYAHDYLSDPVFLHARNLRGHLPYVLRVALEADVEGVEAVVFAA